MFAITSSRATPAQQSPGTAITLSRASAVKATVCLALLGLLVLGAHFGQSSTALFYDRDAILQGEIHRLLTFHFVHISDNHFLINALTLVILWAMYGRALRVGEWLVATLACAGAIGLGLLAFNPEVGWSAGLSGLLYALFAVAAVKSILRRQYLSVAVVAFLIGKIVIEQSVGANPAMVGFVGSAILIDTHMYGVIAGLAMGLAMGLVAGGLTRARGRRPRWPLIRWGTTGATCER